MSTTVLVVDDEPHVLQVMQTFLERADFTVLTASNGEDGLNQAEKHHPDAIITDFEMPRVNGRELLQQILAGSEWTPRVIYLVTSRTDADLRAWVERTACVQFLEKPASPRRLVQSLKDAFNAPAMDIAS